MRIARIFCKQHDHAVVVCVTGTGERAFTKFAPFVTGSKIAEIEVTNHYTIDNFMKDLMNFYTKCSISGKRLVVILSDTRLVNNEFLKVINSILLQLKSNNRSMSLLRVSLHIRMLASKSRINISSF